MKGDLALSVREEHAAVRAFADKAFSRAAGAPLVGGNRVRLLTDAGENYPAWLDAIGAAKRTIHFESYIIHEDAVGRRFADALSQLGIGHGDTVAILAANSPALLEAHYAVPMLGAADSLNVSVCASILLYAARARASGWYRVA